MSGCIKISLPENIKIWSVFFIFTCFSALFIQLILLPYFFPLWHAGDGLLITALDSKGFHAMAVELSGKIKSNGWSVWELRPYEQAPAGIAALIYTIMLPKLWTLIPLNAALHATAAFILFLIIRSLINDLKPSVYCALPFLIYPSAALWYSQLHKDGFVFAGFYLFIYGWMLFFKNRHSFSGLIKAYIGIATGIFLMWVTRPYLVDVFQILCILPAAIVIVKSFIEFSTKKTSLFRLWIIALLALQTIIPLSLFKKDFRHDDFSEAQIIRQFQENKSIRENIPAGISMNENTTGLPVSEGIGLSDTPAAAGTKVAESMPRRRSFNMAAYISGVFRQLSGKRQGFLTTKGASNVDTDKSFSRPIDVFLYIPRAVQIAFFAPFPYQWGRQGTYEANTLMRKVSAAETLGVYFALIFLPYGFWIWRRRIEIWIASYFSFSIMLFYSLIVCNIGTLYRLRYGFIMVFVSFGLAAAATLLKNKHKLKCAE